MSIRFFCDHCIPAQIIASLRSSGHDVIVLRDVISKRAPDPIVIAKAQQLDSVLISLNGDFADIVTYPPSRYGGIIAIQLHDHPEIIPALMTRLHRYLHHNPYRDHYRGKLLVVESHRIRIRS